ncbi:CsbD family protein [Methyloglobulus sp.]|uniref:CsbD family protein n=1 Tax=Methyloglobulus sp. TaxID=2518622 RepID=UPI0039896090
MIWDQIEDNLKEFINNVKEQWIWFIDDQRDVLEGKRNHLTGKTQKAYVIDIDEAEKRLADWQKLQRDKICN